MYTYIARVANPRQKNKGTSHVCFFHTKTRIGSMSAMCIVHVHHYCRNMILSSKDTVYFFEELVFFYNGFPLHIILTYLPIILFIKMKKNFF